MTTLNKINVKGVDYSLDGVKVLELKGERSEYEDGFVWYFGKGDIYIDVNKKIRFEIYRNNELQYGYIVFIDNKDELKFCSIEDGAINNADTIDIDGFYWAFNYGVLERYERYGEFYYSVDNSNVEFNANDNVVLKLYYCEADELSTTYLYEI